MENRPRFSETRIRERGLFRHSHDEDGLGLQMRDAILHRRGSIGVQDHIAEADLWKVYRFIREIA